MSNSFSKELGKGIALDVKVTKKQSRELDALNEGLSN